jgi:hypothetical protein
MRFTSTPNCCVMKVLIKIIVVVVLVNVVCVASVCAQSYTTALGLRVGGTTGVTLKHAIRPSTMVEGIVGGFSNGFSVTGLIEKHTLAFNERGLNWYYGGGAHIAVYNNRGRYDRFGREVDYNRDDDLGLGINGIVGLEYRLPDNVPIAFSVDLKPFIEFTSGGNVGFALDPSIGIKFILR